jgi:ABC-2 type transport system permease protein
MRKTLLIARREYLAAVRSRVFVISLLIVPIMLGGSVLLQYLLRDVRDVKDKHFALIDRTGHLADDVQKRVGLHNQHEISDRATGAQVRPRLLVEVVPPGSESGAVDRARLELSDAVRGGRLVGFVEIGADVLKPKPPGADDDAHVIRSQTNRPTEIEFGRLVEEVVQQARLAEADLNEKQRGLIVPAKLVPKGLSEYNPKTDRVEDAQDENRVVAVLAPMAYLMLMFMVVMMTAGPMMQGVLEEKMQRIAEVLLGSVTPFQLMLGKLLGMTGVSLTIAAVYLGGGYWAAHHFKFGEYAPPHLLLWFGLFQTLAALMFGSLFIAIGAACTDLKETQSLLMPVMLIVCLPMFVLGNVLLEPNGPVATGLSLFPFATPMLMMARLASPGQVPWWQPALGVLLVLATTLLCVWAAGRIFRVGLLMQGKGARFGELLRWVVRG